MPERSVDTLLKSLASEDIREGAYMAGKERRESAVPLLVQHLQNPDIGVQEAADRALRRIGGQTTVRAVIPLLRSDDAQVRNIAMDMLREIGNSDLVSLFALLQDQETDIRIFAADILGSSRSVLAVAPLRDALLHDPEVNVRYQAAVSLGNLGFPEAAPSLSQALEDEEWVQFSVIEALMKIGEESSVAALVKALDACSELVASVIIDALGSIGSIKAVPMLMPRLETTTGPLRNKIVAAIIKILGEDSLGLLGAKERGNLHEYMLSAIRDDEVEIQDAMARGLAALKGEKASAAIASLLAGLDPVRDHERMDFLIEALSGCGVTETVSGMVRGDREVDQHIGVEVVSRAPSTKGLELLKTEFWRLERDPQRSAVLVLANACGPGDASFFLDILQRHPDGNVIRAALMFLRDNARPGPVTEAIRNMLDHPYDDVKEAALEACIALGDETTVGHLRGMAKDPDPVRRMMSIHALGLIDVGAHDSLVLEALNDGNPDVRRVAVEALGRRIPMPARYRQAVTARLDDPETQVRLAAISALNNAGAPEVTDTLIQCLADPDPWVRARCIECLGQRQEGRAACNLAASLADDNELIVIKTVEALARIGGELAFRSVVPLLNHENPDIQRAAEEAVESIRARERA